MPLHSHLPRLSPHAYKGFASVHWIHTTKNRAPLGLDSEFHAKFRELLLHNLAYYQLGCPVYCIMPDHLHLLASGLGEASDQRAFAKRFRGDLNKLIAPNKLQRQGYDSVLRESQRDKNAFSAIAEYILENPVRAKISAAKNDYPYSGCMFPGYFGLDPKEPGFWPRYWRVYDAHLKRSAKV